MTRETKVGLVVAGSFLCLVGVVVASRLGGQPDPEQSDSVTQVAAAKQEPAPKQQTAAPEKKEPENKAQENKKKPSEVVQADLKGATPAPATKATEPGAFPIPSAQSIQSPLFPPSAPATVADNSKKKPLFEDSEQQSAIKTLQEQEKMKKEKEAANHAAITKVPGKPDDLLPPALPLVSVDGIPAAAPAPIAKITKEPEIASSAANGGHSTFPSPAVVPPKEPLAPAAETSKPPVVEPAAAVALANPATTIKPKDTFPPLPPPPDPGLLTNPMNLAAPPPVVKQEPPAAAVAANDAKPKNLPPIPAANPAPPPTQVAMNKELTNPNLPPLGSDFKNPTPPVVVPATSIKPASSTGPKVIDFNVDSYECTPDDTSFEAVSIRKYGSAKYAKALLQYNRQHPLANDTIRKQDNPRLQPRQIVFIPPAQFLEDRFASLIDNRLNTPAPSPLPAVTINAPINSNPVNRVPTPVATSDATKPYRVAGQGQMLIEIAQQTLGDRGRWSEIYRLNPSVRQEYPIPGGTEIRLPANASVP